MNLELIVVIILLLVLSSVSLILFIIYRNQVLQLKENLKFIQERKTNIDLRADFQAKDIIELVDCINCVLDTYKESNRIIENNNKQFKQTITSLSHDLRTPLTSANGYIQLLLSQDLNETQRNYAMIVSERIVALQSLLNQLFELSRMESDELELNYEKVNIHNLLRDVIAMFYNDFTRKNIEPTIEFSDEEVIVYGDAEALKRVFSNIIFNALAHGENKFSIKTVSNKNNFDIMFSNNTNNITLEDINHVFERFYTTDKSRTKRTTGLGLTIAKKLIEMMNSSISASLIEDNFIIQIRFTRMYDTLKKNNEQTIEE